MRKFYYSKKNHTVNVWVKQYAEFVTDGFIEITPEEYNKYWLAQAPDGKRLAINKYPFVLEDIPQPTFEELSLIEKQWRDSELSIYIDHFQKPLVWGDLTADEQSKIADYRRLLLDYPQSEDFKTQTRPVRPDVPPLK